MQETAKSSRGEIDKSTRKKKKKKEQTNSIGAKTKHRKTPTGAAGPRIVEEFFEVSLTQLDDD